MSLPERLDHNGSFSSYDLDRLKLEFDNWESRAIRLDAATFVFTADGWISAFHGYRHRSVTKIEPLAL